MADNDGSGNLLARIANPQQMNYLAAYGQAQQVAQGVWANRRAQADQLAGQAQQGAINPDGTYDPDKYRQNLAAAGPGAALATQSGLTANQSLSDAQFQQAKQKTDWVAKASAGALDSGDYSDAGMMRVLQQGSADGVLTIPEIAKQLQTLPQDAAGRKAWLEQHRAQALSQSQALELQYGKPITTDDGQVIRGGTQDQRTGAINVPGAPAPAAGGQGVQKQTGPETNAALVEVSDAAGNKYKVPRSALPGASGQPPSPLGTGRPPAGLRNPNAPPDQPAPSTGAAPPGAPAGGVLAGVAPATDVENKGAAEHAVAARDLANGYQARIQPIEGALSALSGADTGKASETLNSIRAYTQDVAPAFVQRMLPDSLTNPKSRIAFEEANKYLTGMAINAPGGARSNAGQDAASAATPSVHISNEAAQLVARAALAQQRLTQAGTLAFNQSGQPAANYDRFMNNWNTSADPRAFIADKMSANDRADLVKGMGGTGSAAYQKFKKSYQDGVAAGVIANHAGQ